MYITIDRNTRGNLEISNVVLDKLIEAVTTSTINKPFKNLTVDSELTNENIMHLIIQIKLKSPKERIEFNEKKIIKSIEEAVQQTLNFKPKNIAIAYIK